MLAIRDAGWSLKRQIVGVLHDVKEDNPDEWAYLLANEFVKDEKIIAAIDAISRKPGETWNDYIKRVALNDIARCVKIFDLTDNINRCDLNVHEQKASHARYTKARDFLCEESARIESTYTIYDIAEKEGGF
jgi:hypothetical protein